MVNEKPDLSRLLSACRQGDELAWETLVRHYQGRVYGIAYHYVANAEDARDLTQTIFVQVYGNLDGCSDPGHFLPWLIRICRNASIDFLRRRKVRPPTNDLPVREIGNLAFEGANPEQLSVQESRKKLFYRALQALTSLNREVILLKEIQGLTLDEVASTVGAPLGTIKSRLHRARLELAEKVLALSQSAGKVPWTPKGSR